MCMTIGTMLGHRQAVPTVLGSRALLFGPHEVCRLRYPLPALRGGPERCQEEFGVNLVGLLTPGDGGMIRRESDGSAELGGRDHEAFIEVIDASDMDNCPFGTVMFLEPPGMEKVIVLKSLRSGHAR